MTAVVRPSTRPARRPPAPAPDRPALEVVTEARTAPRSRRRTRILTVGVLVVMATCLLSLTAFHVKLAEGQFELRRLQAEAAEQQARYERLRLQVAELESPARIVASAQERLGMVPPPGVTYLSPSGPVADRPGRRAAQGRREAAAVDEWSDVKRNLTTR